VANSNSEYAENRRILEEFTAEVEANEAKLDYPETTLELLNASLSIASRADERNDDPPTLAHREYGVASVIGILTLALEDEDQDLIEFLVARAKDVMEYIEERHEARELIESGTLDEAAQAFVDAFTSDGDTESAAKAAQKVINDRLGRDVFVGVSVSSPADAMAKAKAAQEAGK